MMLFSFTEANQENKALKFGNSMSDYIMYRPDMGPLQDAFSVCSWVRSLSASDRQTWMSYAVSGSTNEIFITVGYYNQIFTSYNVHLTSYFSELRGSGTWFHNCHTWSYSSRTRKIYLNGQQIHSTTTDSGRRLTTGGYLVIGNDQGGTPGTSGFGSSYIFGGELYQLNFFSKELSSSEVSEMSQNMCSYVERSYGDTRVIKWEDIISLTRNGNITDMESGCKALSMNYFFDFGAHNNHYKLFVIHT